MPATKAGDTEQKFKKIYIKKEVRIKEEGRTEEPRSFPQALVSSHKGGDTRTAKSTFFSCSIKSLRDNICALAFFRRGIEVWCWWHHHCLEVEVTLLGPGNDLLSFSVSSNLSRSQYLIALAPLQPSPSRKVPGVVSVLNFIFKLTSLE